MSVLQHRALWSSPHDVTQPDQRDIAERGTPRAAWRLAEWVLASAFVSLCVEAVRDDWSGLTRLAAFAALGALFGSLQLLWRRSIRRAAEKSGRPSPV